MKCIYKCLFYSLTFTLLSGTQLFWEDFSNDEIPPGWEMESNWQVRSEGWEEHVVGDPPPGACFYWSYPERKEGRHDRESAVIVNNNQPLS